MSVMHVLVRWAAVLWVLSLAAAMGWCEGIRVGLSADEVLGIGGPPTRTIGTGNGTIWFYGPMLVDIVDGRVAFVSVSRNGRADGRFERQTGVLADGDGECDAPDTEPLPDRHARRADPERERWVAEGIRQREERIAERVRHLLLADTFRDLLKPDKWVPHARYGAGLVAARYGRGEGGSPFHDLRDAQGHRVMGRGEPVGGWRSSVFITQTLASVSPY